MRVPWDEVASVVRHEIAQYTASAGLTSHTLPNNSSHVPSDVLGRLRWRLFDLVNATVPASSSRCHSHSLFAFYQHEQAALSDHRLQSSRVPAPVPHNFSSLPSGRRFSHVYWMPLGHTRRGLPSALKSGVLASSVRRYFWSWSGSIKGNAERLDLERGLTPSIADTQLTPSQYALFKRGFFLKTGGFAQGLESIAYTTTLTEAVFVPLPSGFSPDQFRIHEAMEAGAIPALIDRHISVSTEQAMPYLSYLHHLALDPLIIPNNDYGLLLDTLYPMQFVPPALMDAWQCTLFHRYELHMRRLKYMVAAQICQLATQAQLLQTAAAAPSPHNGGI